VTSGKVTGKAIGNTDYFSLEITTGAGLTRSLDIKGGFISIKSGNILKLEIGISSIGRTLFSFSSLKGYIFSSNFSNSWEDSCCLRLYKKVSISDDRSR